MMKKLLLMSAVGALGAFGASAQMQIKGKNVLLNNSKSSVLPASNSLILSFPASEPIGDVTPSGKTTVGGSRWYNYVEYLEKLNPSIQDSAVAPIIWGKNDIKAVYTIASGALEADTIGFVSYGTTFDPAFRSSTVAGSKVLEGFNDPDFDESSVVVTRATPYTIDSISLVGIYGRNNARPSKNDTIRITVINAKADGSGDLPGMQVTGPSMRADYGVDTLLFNYIKYNATTMGADATTKIVKDIILTKDDTSTAFFRSFTKEVNMTVPAGNIVGVTVTFLSGDTYTKYNDTAFTSDAANLYKYGVFRPRFFADPTGVGAGYPSYERGWSNVGFVKYVPNIYNPFYDGKYMSMYTWTETFEAEVPDIALLVSCATCKTIKETSIKENTILSKLNAFPIPASSEFNVPFTVAEKANVVVKISNMIGQTIATQDMGTMSAGQSASAKFNVSNLSSGVYLYSITANGQTVSNRFTIAK